MKSAAATSERNFFCGILLTISFARYAPISEIPIAAIKVAVLYALNLTPPVR